jgi:hypothetical protein
MRLILVFIGGVATVLAVGISASLNYLFGAGLGQSEFEHYLFGGISVVADLWKALGPIIIHALVRGRRFVVALAAGAVWVACFTYAVSSALGLAAQNRMALTGGRDSVRAMYQSAVDELRETETKLSAVGAHRSPSEVEAAITATLARTISIPEHGRSTVGAASQNCSKLVPRAAEGCSEVAALRQELARAIDGVDLEKKISELRAQVQNLRSRGGTLDADPQAELFSRLSRGWISSHDVGLGLVLLLGAVLELVSAFGPVVLASYAHATRLDMPAATCRDMSRTAQTSRATSGLVVEHEAVGNVLEFLAACVEPSRAATGLTIQELVQAYETWCAENRFAALTPNSFVEELDATRQEHGLESKISKVGDRYFGLRLRDQSARQKLITKVNTAGLPVRGRKRSA